MPFWRVGGLVLFATAIALASPQSLARTADGDTSQAGYDARAFRPVDSDIILSDGFLAAHPDQHFRLLGMRARRSGRGEEARGYFRRAARFADKLSQGALGEMYWLGEGGDQDRALAYAWMDLAAERGARILLAHRERYWLQLTEDERDRALREGERIYAEYGDGVAKPRLAKLLTSTRRKVTGSRAGFVGPLAICIGPSLGGCSATVTGEQYYDDRYWVPDRYWEWQDRIILTPGPTGEVNVGPLDVLREVEK